MVARLAAPASLKRDAGPLARGRLNKRVGLLGVHCLSAPPAPSAGPRLTMDRMCRALRKTSPTPQATRLQCVESGGNCVHRRVHGRPGGSGPGTLSFPFGRGGESMDARPGLRCFYLSWCLGGFLFPAAIWAIGQAYFRPHPPTEAELAVAAVHPDVLVRWVSGLALGHLVA